MVTKNTLGFKLSGRVVVFVDSKDLITLFFSSKDLVNLVKISGILVALAYSRTMLTQMVPIQLITTEATKCSFYSSSISLSTTISSTYPLDFISIYKHSIFAYIFCVCKSEMSPTKRVWIFFIDFNPTTHMNICNTHVLQYIFGPSQCHSTYNLRHRCLIEAYKGNNSESLG